jgi:hypothetical protein
VRIPSHEATHVLAKPSIVMKPKLRYWVSANMMREHGKENACPQHLFLAHDSHFMPVGFGTSEFLLDMAMAFIVAVDSVHSWRWGTVRGVSFAHVLVVDVKILHGDCLLASGKTRKARKCLVVVGKSSRFEVEKGSCHVFAQSIHMKGNSQTLHDERDIQQLPLALYQ